VLYYACCQSSAGSTVWRSGSRLGGGPCLPGRKLGHYVTAAMHVDRHHHHTFPSHKYLRSSLYLLTLSTRHITTRNNIKPIRVHPKISTATYHNVQPCYPRAWCHRRWRCWLLPVLRRRRPKACREEGRAYVDHHDREMHIV
jgi:hypothetical protein